MAALALILLLDLMALWWIRPSTVLSLVGRGVKKENIAWCSIIRGGESGHSKDLMEPELSQLLDCLDKITIHPAEAQSGIPAGAQEYRFYLISEDHQTTIGFSYYEGGYFLYDQTCYQASARQDKLQEFLMSLDWKTASIEVRPADGTDLFRLRALCVSREN